MSGLSAADVRRIVREEVRSALSDVTFHFGEREPQFFISDDFSDVRPESVVKLIRALDEDSRLRVRVDEERVASLVRVDGEESAASTVLEDADREEHVDGGGTAASDGGPVDLDQVHASPSGLGARVSASVTRTVGDGVGPGSGSGPAHTPRHRADTCTGGVFCPVRGHVEYRPAGGGGYQMVHVRT